MKKKYSAAQIKAIRYQYWLRSQRNKKLKETKSIHSFKLIGTKRKLKTLKRLDSFEKLVEEDWKNRTYEIKRTPIKDTQKGFYFIYDKVKEPEQIITTAKKSGYIPLRVWNSTYDEESGLSFDESRQAIVFVKAKTEKDAVELFNKSKAAKRFPIVDKDPAKAYRQQRQLAHALKMRNRELDQFDIDNFYG